MESVALYSETIGNGFPLVMLHGWGQSSKALKPLADLLSQQSRVILIDLPGFGRSASPKEVWSTHDYARYISNYLKRMGVRQFDLLGHSFGGKISISLTSLYPDRVNRLILLASSGLKRRLTLPQILRKNLLKYAASSLKIIDSMAKTQLFQNYFVPKYGSADYQKAGAMRAILVKTVNEDISLQMASIVAPTLILWGENDEETPPEIAERMHNLIPYSQLQLFPGKGHQLFADCGSHLCASYILPFIKEGQIDV